MGKNKKKKVQTGVKARRNTPRDSKSFKAAAEIVSWGRG